MHEILALQAIPAPDQPAGPGVAITTLTSMISVFNCEGNFSAYCTGPRP